MIGVVPRRVLCPLSPGIQFYRRSLGDLGGSSECTFTGARGIKANHRGRHDSNLV